MRAALAVLCVLAGPARAAPDLDALVAAVPACDPARAHCFGIRLHVPVMADGPLATAAWIAAQLAQANHHFAAIDVGFQIAGIAPLPAAAAHVADRAARDALGARIAGPVIDVFVTGQLDDVDTPGVTIRGVAWRRGARKFVILSTDAWDRVLAHELGHVFGLPHSPYAISIMNKTPRLAPPPAERTFAEPELAAMRPRAAAFVRARVLANLRVRARR